MTYTRLNPKNYLPLAGGTMTGNLTINKSSPLFIGEDSEIDLSSATNGVSAAKYPGFVVLDKFGRIAMRLEDVAQNNGANGFNLYARQYDSNGNTTAQKGIKGMIPKGSTEMTYTVGSSANFRDAIGLGDSTKVTTISQVFEADTSKCTCEGVEYVSWGKVAMLNLHVKTTVAITVPANGNIDNITLGQLVSGKRPYINCNALIVDYTGFVVITSSGSVNLASLDARNASYTLASGTDLYIRSTYILP